jgi:hypothetical protein
MMTANGGCKRYASRTRKRPRNAEPRRTQAKRTKLIACPPTAAALSLGSNGDQVAGDLIESSLVPQVKPMFQVKLPGSIGVLAFADLPIADRRMLAQREIEFVAEDD